jgi:hypothetical protein
VRGYFVKAESIEETTKWYRNGHKNAGIGSRFDDLEEEYAERQELKLSHPAVEFWNFFWEINRFLLVESHSGYGRRKVSTLCQRGFWIRERASSSYPHCQESRVGGSM